MNRVEEQISTSLDKSNPFLLTPQEKWRREIYRRCERYYRHPMDTRGGNSLYDSLIANAMTIARWKNLPRGMVSNYNFVPKIVEADRAGLLCNARLEGVSVLKLTTDNRQLTTNNRQLSTNNSLTALLRDILAENRYFLLLSTIFETGISKGDAYLKVMEDPSYREGIRFVPVQPEIVFPYLDPHDVERVIAYKIAYTFKSLSQSNLYGTAGLKDLAYDGDEHQYSEIITSESTMVYIDGELDEKRSYRHRIPGMGMYHIANIPVAGDFYGLPSAHDIYDDIDVLNRLMAVYLRILDFWMYPQIIAKGIKKKERERWGMRVIHYVDTDADFKILEPQHNPGIKELIETLVKCLKEKKPQFALEKLASGVEASSAIRMKLYDYLAHINLLSVSYSTGISEACKYALKLKKPTFNEDVKIDLGSPIPNNEGEQYENLLKLKELLNPPPEELAKMAGM